MKNTRTFVLAAAVAMVGLCTMSLGARTALLGKFRETVTDSSGAPVSGASVRIHSQGATADAEATGSAPSDVIVTVDDVGAVQVSGSVYIYEDDEVTQVLSSSGDPIFLVKAITQSLPNVYTITLDGTSFTGSLTVPLGARLIPVATQTLYADGVGDDTKANPLTTDTDGMAFAWLEGGYYDAFIYGSGATSRWLYDVHIGAERATSHVVSDADFVAFRKATSRGLSAGKIESWFNQNTERASLDHSGKLQIDGLLDVDGGADIEGNVDINGTLTGLTGLTVDGLLDVNGGADIEGNVDINGTLTGLTGLTVASGSVNLPAGAIGTAALALNSVADLKAALTSVVDVPVTGTTHNVVLSTSFTPQSSDSVIVAIAMIRPSLESAPQGHHAGTVRIRRTTGGGSTLSQVATTRQDKIQTGQTNERNAMVVIGIETGVTGSHTWRLEIAAGHASQKIHSHGDESTTYFWVLELKKAS